MGEAERGGGSRTLRVSGGESVCVRERVCTCAWARGVPARPKQNSAPAAAIWGRTRTAAERPCLPRRGRSPPATAGCGAPGGMSVGMGTRRGGGGRSRRGTHCGCLAPPRGDGSLPLGFSPGPRLGGRLFLAVILGVKGLFSALLVKTSSLTEAGARGRAQEPGCGRWGLRVGFPRG